MIELKDLKKIYYTKSKQQRVALENVNLTFPDTGMIFVVGKSGSGKTTLLNLIGGMDDVTEGRIFVDGNELTDGEKHYVCDAYRNSYAGFVFQDYYLIPSLTVFENVRVALDLQNKKDDGLILDALKKVGLDGLENRYPNELSGGQQQRVAIARAIVKNPKLILADEPTGNLDENTSVQILDLLKELSKNSLVLVVSHNTDNAYAYGDRVLELSEGRVIADEDRNDAYDDGLMIDLDTVSIPADRPLTANEITRLNEVVNDRKICFTQHKKHFIPAKQPTYDEKNICSATFEKSRIPSKMKLFFAYKFTMQGALNFVISTILVSLMLILFGLCLLLVKINVNDLIKNLSGKSSNLILLQKGYSGKTINKTLLTDKLGTVTDEDIAAFEDAGYGGNVFLLCNDAILMKETDFDVESGRPLEQGAAYKEFFAVQAAGTLICNEQYLTNVFGRDGKLSYDGQLNKFEYGTIITDYIADCLIYYDTCASYEDILSTESVLGRFRVNAIIYTGYREKYGAMLDDFFGAASTDDFEGALASIYESDAYARFVDEARLSLNIAYSVCPNYLAAKSKSVVKQFARLMNADIVDVNDNVVGRSQAKYHVYLDESLSPGNLRIDNQIFKEWFGDGAAAGDTITIRGYLCDDTARNNVVYQKTFVVASTFDNSYDQQLLYLSKTDFELLRQFDCFPYAVLFDDASEMDKLYNVGQNRNFYSNSSDEQAAYQITNILGAYGPLFIVLSSLAFVISVLILTGFGRRTVRNRKYEIGLLKALGARKGEISAIFIIQILFAACIICIVSTLCFLGVVELTNDVLLKSLSDITKNIGFAQLSLIAVSPEILIILLSMTIAISLISCLIPILSLNKIRPINIRAKD